MDEQFTLQWNNYIGHITDAFGALRNEEDLVDVTLSCERKTLKAHKMLLSACSSYFREIFKENPCQHPVIVFRNVKYKDLEAIIHFMYKGEIDVAQDEIQSFLEMAEMLQVKGLVVDTDIDICEEEKQEGSKSETPTVLQTKDESSSTSSVISQFVKRKPVGADGNATSIEESPHKKIKIDKHSKKEESFHGFNVSQVETKKCTVVLNKVPVKFDSDEQLTDDSHYNPESSICKQEELDQSNVSDFLSEYRTSAKRIESLESKLDLLLTQMSTKLQNTDSRHDSVVPFDESSTLIQSLPAGPDAFKELNEKIAKDSSLKKSLSTVLKALAVTDLRTSVHNMLRRLMTEETAVKYSLTGKPNGSFTKICFENTEVFKLIYATILQTHQVNGSYMTARTAAGLWLTQAKFRYLRKSSALHSKENKEEEEAEREKLLSILSEGQ